MNTLPDLLLEPLVRDALREDLGRAGDITTDAVVPADLVGRVALVARQPGVVAGLDLARLGFTLTDARIRFEPALSDGARVAAGQTLATVTGPARGLLTGERVALNFLCHLSGIATVTRGIADAISGHRARVCCTRKTTPGLRAVEKAAVRAGGGMNHRFGLDDAVLIKDNHIALAGGVLTAIDRARAAVGHLVKIEVEVDTLDQLEAVLTRRVDAVLLDNMDPPTLRRAVAMIGGRAIAEASGGVTPQSAPAIAETGVDLISVGWLTHSAPVLDVGLDYEESWTPV